MHSRDDQHVVLAVNPNSGAVESRRWIDELRAKYESSDFECHAFEDLKSVADCCRDLKSQDKLRAVVAAGGDGTADALANRLDPEIPLLLFPAGTENLLAKQFGIERDVAQSHQILLQDKRVRMDAGVANGQIFLVMASCGYDAEVVREMARVRTGHIRRWSYAVPIWRALRKYRFPQIPFQLDSHTEMGEMENAVTETEASRLVDETLSQGSRSARNSTQGDAIRGSAAWIFVFNVPKYAARLDFCPQADPHDGLLDVCTFEQSGLPSGLNYLVRLFLGSHQKLPSFRHFRCRQIDLGAPQERGGRIIDDVPFQLDGDPGGSLPLNIRVLPNRLTLLTP